MSHIDGAGREDAVEESSWNDSFESNFRYGKRLAFRRSRADKGITWIGSDSACTTSRPPSFGVVVEFIVESAQGATENRYQCLLIRSSHGMGGECGTRMWSVPH